MKTNLLFIYPNLYKCPRCDEKMERSEEIEYSTQVKYICPCCGYSEYRDE